MRAEFERFESWPVATPVDVMLERVRGRAVVLRRRRRVALAVSPVLVVLMAALLAWLPDSGSTRSQMRMVPPAGAPDVVERSSGPIVSTTVPSVPAPSTTTTLPVAPPAAASAPVAVSARGQIAFVRSRRVWVMNADGSGARAITKDTDNITNPVWSPDGRRLAAVWEGAFVERIVVLELDGTFRYLTDFVQSVTGLSWSPDGTMLAVGMSEPLFGGPHIWVMRPDGSERRLVYQGGMQPDWNGNSRTIVFACGNGICTVDADGSNPGVLPFSYYYQYPKWSPDGRWLLAVKIFQNGDARVVRVRTDGTEERFVSDQMTFWFDWSPDGKWIAYAVWGDGATCTEQVAIVCTGSSGSELWLAKADLSERRRAGRAGDQFMSFGPPPG